MPHQIGFVDNSVQLAHKAMLAAIHAFASANGWAVLRYETPAGGDHQLILKGAGFSGLEEIFVGFRTYESAANDYYNLLAGVFTGYAPSNGFDNQPGAMLSGVPCHNQRVDYWLTLNPQRIALAMKVGTPVYESAYVGKFLPYARPGQYPYPVVCGGMLTGAAATRFSDAAHSMYCKGNRANMLLRSPAGALQPFCVPWNTSYLTGSQGQIRDTNGHYPLMPVDMYHTSHGVFGSLDGIYHVSGFNNTVESTLVIGGANYLVMQDVGRTGFSDYYAMRMD